MDEIQEFRDLIQDVHDRAYQQGHHDGSVKGYHLGLSIGRQHGDMVNSQPCGTGDTAEPCLINTKADRELDELLEDVEL